MTKSDFFKKNQTPFNKVLDEFDAQKALGYKSLESFLESPHYTPKFAKFKFGDILIIKINDKLKKQGWREHMVLKVNGIHIFNKEYHMKVLTPNVMNEYDYRQDLPISFVDSNFILY